MAGTGQVDHLKQRARRLKCETHALYLAARDPRTPWYAKLLAAAVVGYAVSPLDLIPDFVPVLGYLDDLIIVPLGIALALRLVPVDVLAECRHRAGGATDLTSSRVAALVVVAIWVSLAALVLLWSVQHLVR